MLILPDDSPILEKLANEYNIDVMKKSEYYAEHSKEEHGKVLKLLYFNVMPTAFKILAEEQIFSIIGNTAFPIEISFLITSDYKPHFDDEGVQNYFVNNYKHLSDIKGEKFDAMITTGANFGLIDFADIAFWDELEQIFDWSKTNVFARLFLCWSVFAAIYHEFGVNKKVRENRHLGVFRYKKLREHPFLEYFDDNIYAPHTRYATFDTEELGKIIYEGKLIPLTHRDSMGPNILVQPDNRTAYLIDHFEYDRDFLTDVYWFDVNSGRTSDLPSNYYPEDDMSRTPTVSWKAHGRLFYQNWLDWVYTHNSNFSSSKKAK